MPPLRADQTRRIEKLQRRLIKDNLTKYNLHRICNLQQETSCILVPGQVAEDASVLSGGDPKGNNLSLLKRVRRANPNAFILYKPHPDVDSNLRRRASTKRIVCAMPMIASKIVAQHRHSEAVMRCKLAHHWWGLSAAARYLRYNIWKNILSSWGFTNDLEPKIKPSLTLQKFLYGCLIIYQRYFDPVTRRACPIEVIIDRLLDFSARRPSQANRALA